MPATTTFCDIKMTEKVEAYTYENIEYDWNEGDIVSLPQHTANRFVNRWDKAEWSKGAYEVPEEDYDYVVGRVRNEDGGEMAYCEAEKADGEVCGREKPCAYHDDEE